MLQYLTAVSRYKEQNLQSQQHGQEVQWMEWGCEYSWGMNGCKALHVHPTNWEHRNWQPICTLAK